MQQVGRQRNDMTVNATHPEPWARLRLVQGESKARVWELVAARGQTLLTVGSNSACNWVVQAAGVQPIHFSLHWDGQVLKIADTHAGGAEPCGPDAGCRCDCRPWRAPRHAEPPIG